MRRLQGEGDRLRHAKHRGPHFRGLQDRRRNNPANRRVRGAWLPARRSRNLSQRWMLVANLNIRRIAEPGLAAHTPPGSVFFRRRESGSDRQ